MSGAVQREREDWRKEIAELRARLAAAEDLLRAIRSGEVDAVVIDTADGPQVYTLKGAEHPYRILVEQMQEGAATVTGDGAILYCNRRFAEMLRTPQGRLIGRSIHPFVPEGERPGFVTLLAGSGGKRELDLRAADGTVLPVYVSVNPLTIDEVRSLCLVVTDLTQQKRSEAIVAAERLARSILEHATEAIVVCDTEQNITHASQAAHRLSGGNPVGRAFAAALPLGAAPGLGEPPAAPAAAGAPAVESWIAAALAGQVVHGNGVELRGADGALQQFLLSAGPLYGARREIIGCVVILTDISQRRLAEQALRESEERYRLLVEMNPDALFVNAGGRIVFANTAMLTLFGARAPVLMLGRKPLDFVHPDSRALVEERICRLLETGRPQPAVEQKWVRLDGSVVEVEAIAAPLPWRGGTGIQVILRDITERKRTAAALEAALEEKDVLLREVNHRVKNSLQLISSLLNLQARTIDDPEARRQFAEACNRVHTVAQVHRRLYQSERVDRIEFGQFLHELCAEIGESLNAQATHPVIAVEAARAELGTDQVIPLAMIVNELITNAFKYAYPDGATGTVSVAFSIAPDGERRLVVADDGVGLMDGFDPVRTGGLGMKLVRALVAQLGGRFEVGRSRPGARFTVTLPAAV